ncbi:hypothetical protein [Bradyrhizobium sp.]|jgi:hypothetical protein|uniref:hypothetical protein n=1 Tax=Bradyrhizobium sp. TaxID=376 RepID=UPI002DDD4012|nr:hypothetical protein [Bradyrhizobium sp.]HEV2153944.1 hypothetical protein [Bradyrhizobium sp.]
MTIRLLLHDCSAPADEVSKLYGAYRRTLRSLYLVDRGDPVCEIVARRIIEIAEAGVRDPKLISRMAIEQFDDSGMSRRIG